MRIVLEFIPIILIGIVILALSGTVQLSRTLAYWNNRFEDKPLKKRFNYWYWHIFKWLLSSRDRNL